MENSPLDSQMEKELQKVPDTLTVSQKARTKPLVLGLLLIVGAIIGTAVYSNTHFLLGDTTQNRQEQRIANPSACNFITQDAIDFANNNNNGVITPEDRSAICECRKENNLTPGPHCSDTVEELNLNNEDRLPQIEDPGHVRQVFPDGEGPVPFDFDAFDAILQEIVNRTKVPDSYLFVSPETQNPVCNTETLVTKQQSASELLKKSSDGILEVLQFGQDVRKNFPTNGDFFDKPKIAARIVNAVNTILNSRKKLNSANTFDTMTQEITGAQTTFIQDAPNCGKNEELSFVPQKISRLLAIQKAYAQADMPLCQSCEGFELAIEQLEADIANLELIEPLFDQALAQSVEGVGSLGDVPVGTFANEVNRLNQHLAPLRQAQQNCLGAVAILRENNQCVDKKDGSRIINDARCDQNCNVDLIRINRRSIENTLTNLQTQLTLLFDEVQNTETTAQDITAQLTNIRYLIDRIEIGYKQYTATSTEQSVLTCVQNKFQATYSGLCFGKNRCDACKELEDFYKIFVNEAQNYKDISSDILKSFVTLIDYIQEDTIEGEKLQKYAQDTENIINELLPKMSLRKATRENIEAQLATCQERIDTLTEINQCTTDGI